MQIDFNTLRYMWATNPAWVARQAYRPHHPYRVMCLGMVVALRGVTP
jgi:hypothetical protein